MNRGDMYAAFCIQSANMHLIREDVWNVDKNKLRLLNVIRSTYMMLRISITGKICLNFIRK